MKMPPSEVIFRWLTRVSHFFLVLDDGYSCNSSDYSNSDHLQPNVQPLHCGVTGKTAALIQFKSQLVLCLKPRLDTTQRLI